MDDQSLQQLPVKDVETLGNVQNKTGKGTASGNLTRDQVAEKGRNCPCTQAWRDQRFGNTSGVLHKLESLDLIPDTLRDTSNGDWADHGPSGTGVIGLPEQNQHPCRKLLRPSASQLGPLENPEEEFCELVGQPKQFLNGPAVCSPHGTAFSRPQCSLPILQIQWTQFHLRKGGQV